MVPSSDPPPDDALLLRRYVREGSEASFRALAERHLPLVWSTARRIVHGDDTLAEEIAQSVLTDFALKAPALPPDMPPAGWLHRHTVFTACKTLRCENRRRAREQRAVTPPDDPMPAPPDIWAELAPHLDTALNRLSESDRQALLLRYYEKRPLHDISRVLGTTAEATRKRLDRALTKLRTLLSRRGLVPALAAFALLLRDESIAAPAASVTRRITGAVWSKIELGGGGSPAFIPWWQSRRFLRRAMASVCLLSLLSLVWRSGLFSSEKRRHVPKTGTASLKRSADSTPVENYPPITLTVTLMTLPESEVVPLMMDYTPGSGDQQLYQQLLPRAAALQKLFRLDETFATTGHSLIVLTGPAKPSRTAFQKRPDPPPPAADPFDEAPALPPPGPSAWLHRIVPYKYPTEFDGPDARGHMTGSAESFKNTGTDIRANVSPPDEQGTMLFECSATHMLAHPGKEILASLAQPEGSQAEDGTVIHQPVFYTSQWNLGPLTVQENRIVLAGMMSVPSDILPETDRSPRRLLLFIQLDP